MVKSETNSDDENFEEHFEDLSHKHPMTRVFALGKLNRVLERFKNAELSPLDIRLLKGFYVDNWNELHPS